jgi:uncharacterized protein DUF6507
MSSWDIDPSGVRGVVGRTEGVAKSFEGQMTTLENALSGAAAQSSSGIVGEALSGFAEANKGQIQFVFTRTGACLNAAAQATNAYLDGDLTMAANAQRAASVAPQPQPPHK